MNLQQCMHILSQRQAGSNDKSMSTGGCSCCFQEELKNNGAMDIYSAAISAIDAPSASPLESMSDVELVDLLMRLQVERVGTYNMYDNTLAYLLRENKLEDYTKLCAEITSIFAVISSNVNNIRVLYLKNEGYSSKKTIQNIVVEINKLQEKEKEKLMLTAAKHLNIIQTHTNKAVAVESSSDGDDDKRRSSNITIATDQKYVMEKISEIHEAVAECLDNIQALKLDLLEASS